MDSMHGAFISWCCIWALLGVTVHRHVLKHGLKNTFECFPFHCFDLQLSLWTSDDPPERTPSSGNYDSPKHPCAICGGDHLCYRLDLHEPISPWQSPVGSRAPDFEVHWKREWHDDMSSWQTCHIIWCHSRCRTLMTTAVFAIKPQLKWRHSESHSKLLITTCYCSHDYIHYGDCRYKLEYYCQERLWGGKLDFGSNHTQHLSKGYRRECWLQNGHVSLWARACNEYIAPSVILEIHCVVIGWRRPTINCWLPFFKLFHLRGALEFTGKRPNIQSCLQALREIHRFIWFLISIV